MQSLKIHLNSGNHSAGRGVGFYAANLYTSLSKIKTLKLTDLNPDIVHYPFFDLFYPTLPLIKHKPTIVTIHDLTPLVLKDKYPKGLRGSINLLRQRLALINTAAIITDSHSSKKDIVNIFNIPQKKVYVVYLDCDPLFKQKVSATQQAKIKKKYKLPQKFVLCVPGHPNPNKNLPLLAQVTKELAIPLVLVGGGMTQKLPAGSVHPELADLKKLQGYKHIIYPGFVPTTDLPAIYKQATLYCQPSLYEGFGIPILEALNTKTLLLSSNTSSLPELYGNSAISFNPASKNSLKKALTKALNLSPAQKQKAVDKGLLQAKKFSWPKTAQAMTKIYSSIAANHH